MKATRAYVSAMSATTRKVAGLKVEPGPLVLVATRVTAGMNQEGKVRAGKPALRGCELVSGRDDD